MRKSFLLLIIPFILASCSEQKNKQAYCFSTVFDESDGMVTITNYCKTASKDSSSQNTVSITLTLTGTDFKEAFSSIEDLEYDIYYNSTLAYFISSSVSEQNIKDLTVILLDNTKHRKDNYIYSPEQIKATTEELHKEAQSICEDETITSNMLKSYIPALTGLRKLSDK